MSDDADKAYGATEHLTNTAINQARVDANKPIEITGKCLNCDEPVEGKRWCSVECRDEGELINERRR